MVNIENPNSLEISEIIKSNSLARVTLNSLIKVCSSHREMGEKGKEKDVINQFGEQALRADLAAEQKILESFGRYSKKRGVCLEVRGEETATTLLGSRGDRYFALLDGLDGSSNYLTPNDWAYGTMLALAKGNNPIYKDFEIAGIALPEENWVLLAIKGAGVFIYIIDDNEYKKLKNFGQTEYDDGKILSDNYFPEAKKMLGDRQNIWPRTGSTAASVTAMAIGNHIGDVTYPIMNKDWQGLADVTRKGNLEQPAVYLILSELGGAMIDKDGKDIGDHSFKEWGQNEKVPLISGKSKEICKIIYSKLNI